MAKWILEQTTKFLDYEAVRIEEALLAESDGSRRSAEVQIQAQFYLIGNSLYKQIESLGWGRSTEFESPVSDTKGASQKSSPALEKPYADSVQLFSHDGSEDLASQQTNLPVPSKLPASRSPAQRVSETEDGSSDKKIQHKRSDAKVEQKLEGSFELAVQQRLEDRCQQKASGEIVTIMGPPNNAKRKLRASPNLQKKRMCLSDNSFTPKRQKRSVQIQSPEESPLRALSQYKLTLEAKAEGSSMRLDILAKNGTQIRLGWELLVGNDQKDFDRHVKKAKKYSKQHNCLTFVVNFDMQAKEDDSLLQFQCRRQGKFLMVP